MADRALLAGYPRYIFCEFEAWQERCRRWLYLPDLIKWILHRVHTQFITVKQYILIATVSVEKIRCRKYSEVTSPSWLLAALCSEVMSCAVRHVITRSQTSPPYLHALEWCSNLADVRKHNDGRKITPFKHAMICHNQDGMDPIPLCQSNSSLVLINQDMFKGVCVRTMFIFQHLVLLAIFPCAYTHWGNDMTINKDDKKYQQWLDNSHYFENSAQGPDSI